MPRSNLRKLEEALSKAPYFLRTSRSLTVNPTTHPAGQHHVTNSPTSSAQSSVQGPYRQASQSLPSNSHSQANCLPNSGHPSTSQQPLYPTQQGQGTVIDPKHVFLGVKRGSDYQVDNIEVQFLNDTQFFHRLKQKYLSLRGWRRNIFSWWRYDHCDFYRFRKYAPRSITVCQQQFPPNSNLEYEFQPRPMEPQPPIDDHEFRMRFYHSCEEPHSWHRHQCNRFSTSDKQAITVLPKRTQALDLEGDERTDFWGIYARERRAFLWVAIYFFLCNVPGMLFFFVWLFGLKHKMDLQDGTTLLGISVTLTFGFIALLYESRDPDRK